jgi:hypothetical protein
MKVIRILLHLAFATLILLSLSFIVLAVIGLIKYIW